MGQPLPFDKTLSNTNRDVCSLPSYIAKIVEIASNVMRGPGFMLYPVNVCLTCERVRRSRLARRLRKQAV